MCIFLLTFTINLYNLVWSLASDLAPNAKGGQALDTAVLCIPTKLRGWIHAYELCANCTCFYFLTIGASFYVCVPSAIRVSAAGAAALCTFFKCWVRTTKQFPARCS